MGSITQVWGNSWASGVWATGTWGYTPTATFTGGWWGAFEREMSRRERERKKLEQKLEETRKIEDKVTRDIALEERRIEQNNARLRELERLQALAQEHERTIQRNVNERVRAAYTRTQLKKSFSALEALERELKRAKEEEDFLIMAIQVIHNG